ncbi:MAG TPA: dephospho-CoA kinase [Verrucomicrobiae bacterium]|jgi:dephospho-CoA kinase|nr:dephospho-CoA kinase [Verrucomicrobiae bacterium]
MKLCGLTGGVGMGKSTAAGFFLQRGARLIDTDEIARELVRPGQPALAEIKKEFGEGIISSIGELKRAELAQIVFTDTVARKKLEAILHPRIREHWLAQIEIWRKEDCPLAVVVIPLLFETQAESQFDKIICVACSAKTRRERLLARKWTSEQINQRIAAQMPVEEKIARADFVVWTDGDLDAHARQLDRILAKL